MSRLKNWGQILKKHPNKIFFQEIIWKIIQTTRSYFFLSRSKNTPCDVSAKHGLELLKGNDDFLQNLPPFFFNPQEKDIYRQSIEKNFTSTEKESVLEEAELICQNRFRILGEHVDFSSTGINWHIDFKSGYCWNNDKAYYEKKSLNQIVVGKGSDVKVPWELSRLQFIIPLGQAYWLSGEEKYARQFIKILNDWIDQNPPYKGINWASPMEVAIRAANIIWGIYFFSASPNCEKNFSLRLVSLLERHGQFIWNNLEKWFEHTGNHYLANLTGLTYLGIFLSNSKWLNFACEEIQSQINQQVLDDGVDFEASTSYHKLAIECFLFPALLCRINKIPFSQSFWDKLKKMFFYTQSYLKPNGHAPQIGDNDNGCIHILGKHSVTDHSYLLTIASVLFEDNAFTTKDLSHPQEILWLFGPNALKNYQHKPDSKTILSSNSFPNAGIYIMRHEQAYMLISCGPNGFYGKGAHAHNDKLSFELNFNGEDFIVDPGCYTYTPYPEERDLFRSTAYHNTIRIDKEEQNRIPLNETFRLENDSHPKLIKWQSDPERDIFEGKNNGYSRLDKPVTHIRQILFDKKNLTWQIIDNLKGEGKHLLEWYFHLAPEIEAEIKSKQDKIQIILIGKNNTLTIETEGWPDDISLKEGYYSAGYGHKQPTLFICSPKEVTLPYKKSFFIKVL